MSVSLRADAGGAIGALALNGSDKLVLNADGTLSGTTDPTTGVRSHVLATMQKFADEFGSSLAASGYQKLPSGLIIQWMTVVTVAGGGSGTVSWPIVFPNQFLSGVCTQFFAGVPTAYAAINTCTASTASVASSAGTSGQTIRIIAVGN